MLLRGREDGVLVNVWDCRQKCSNVTHGDCLEGDADRQRPLPPNNVDEEQSTHDRGDKFDNSKDGSGVQLFILAFGTKQGEHVWGVLLTRISVLSTRMTTGTYDGDTLSAGPLAEQLCPEAKVNAVEVVGHAKHFSKVWSNMSAVSPRKWLLGQRQTYIQRTLDPSSPPVLLQAGV
jgi:hypothetical protein